MINERYKGFDRDESTNSLQNVTRGTDINGLPHYIYIENNTYTPAACILECFEQVNGREFYLTHPEFSGIGKKPHLYNKKELSGFLTRELSSMERSLEDFPSLQDRIKDRILLLDRLLKGIAPHK